MKWLLGPPSPTSRTMPTTPTASPCHICCPCHPPAPCPHHSRRFLLRRWLPAVRVGIWHASPAHCVLAPCIPEQGTRTLRVCHVSTGARFRPSLGGLGIGGERGGWVCRKLPPTPHLWVYPLLLAGLIVDGRAGCGWDQLLVGY